MNIRMRYRHEGRSNPSSYKVPVQHRKDRCELLDEYVKSHDVISRSYLTKLSFREPTTTLKNYTFKTGQTFIQIDYDTWHKGDTVAIKENIRTGRPFKKPIDYTNKCIMCKLVWVNKSKHKNTTGRCRSCSQKNRYIK